MRPKSKRTDGALRATIAYWIVIGFLGILLSAICDSMGIK